MRLPEPVRIGWKSVAANALPMAVLWLLAGYGSDDEPFDSRFRTWLESEGANFDPSAAPGFFLFLR